MRLPIVMAMALLLGTFACEDNMTVENLPKVDLPVKEEPPAEPEVPADPQTAEDFAAVAKNQITAENLVEVVDQLEQELDAELAELEK
ncbi:MAG: hypothetical protein AAF658_19655 [Myxococcota bacterium]